MTIGHRWGHLALPLVGNSLPAHSPPPTPISDSSSSSFSGPGSSPDPQTSLPHCPSHRNSGTRGPSPRPAVEAKRPGGRELGWEHGGTGDGGTGGTGFQGGAAPPRAPWPSAGRPWTLKPPQARRAPRRPGSPPPIAATEATRRALRSAYPVARGRATKEGGRGTVDEPGPPAPGGGASPRRRVRAGAVRVSRCVPCGPRGGTGSAAWIGAW